MPPTAFIVLALALIFRLLFFYLNKEAFRMPLKLGDKVRNIHNQMEGILVPSTSGASVSGRKVLPDGSFGRFHTLGAPLHEYEADWKRIYKFKYAMKETE